LGPIPAQLAHFPPTPVRERNQTNPPRAGRGGFFYFFYFLFPFFTKIYFRFGNLQKYTPAALLPGGRDLADRQPGGRDLSAKKLRQKIADRSLGTGRPAAGRPAPQAARQRGGRPWAFRACAIQLSRARRQRRPIDRRSEAWTTPLLLGGDLKSDADATASTELCRHLSIDRNRLQSCSRIHASARLLAACSAQCASSFATPILHACYDVQQWSCLVPDLKFLKWNFFTFKILNIV